MIELAKSKYSFEIANKEALITALETVKHAVEVGELDAQINVASEHARRVFERSVT